MEWKPKPLAMSGAAHEHFQNGNIPEALRAHAQANHERVILANLSNPLTLSTMTRAWVEAQLPTYPHALEDWRSAVNMRVKNFPTEIAHCVAGACKKPTRDVERPGLSFCGKDDIVYLSHCPMCGEAGVQLKRIDPVHFQPGNRFSRLLSMQVCDHDLPLDDKLWQAIRNASELIREGYIGSF